jgi:hypothetical protein
MNGAAMFQIGDLVKYIGFGKHNAELIGFMESTSDGKIGVRWLTTKFGYCAGSLSVFNNPLDYLRKVDKVEE